MPSLVMPSLVMPSPVMSAFLLVLPLLLALLGLTAVRRDWLSGAVLLSICAGFVGCITWQVLGRLPAGSPAGSLAGSLADFPAEMLPEILAEILPEILAETLSQWTPAFLWLWPLAAFGLWVRLYRDRRQGHRRSTVESLAVLGCGALLLMVVMSLPGIIGEVGARPG